MTFNQTRTSSKFKQNFYPNIARGDRANLNYFSEKEACPLIFKSRHKRKMIKKTVIRFEQFGSP